jgi:hypothetical protein
MADDPDGVLPEELEAIEGEDGVDEVRASSAQASTPLVRGAARCLPTHAP